MRMANDRGLHWGLLLWDQPQDWDLSSRLMFCTLPVGDSGLSMLDESVSKLFTESFVPRLLHPLSDFCSFLVVVVRARMVSALATDMCRPPR